MSTGQQAISLEEAVAQLNALEEQIKRLQDAVLDVSSRMARLSEIEEALISLSGGSEDALVPLGESGVLVHASIKPVEKAVVHIGLDVFVEVPREKALELVREERSTLSKMLDGYNAELAKLSQYYSALRAAVEQALAAREAAARRQQGRQH